MKESKITSFGLVAWLWYENFSTTKIEKVEDRVHFFFEESDELRAAIDKFINGEAQVEPRAYNNLFKVVRMRAYALTSNKRNANKRGHGGFKEAGRATESTAGG